MAVLRTFAFVGLADDFPNAVDRLGKLTSTRSTLGMLAGGGGWAGMRREQQQKQRGELHPANQRGNHYESVGAAMRDVARDGSDEEVYEAARRHVEYVAASSQRERARA